eukprot:CAMPEP_0175073674 /NCGR_PEP_ID=MMETSP0052_2-20121109/20744_1 /TAXON_ID=51329 ORGANISM="Polytomella parva, Strain SAG 63-3" /NCGR_SAMPLE_ID=MMETSP0052_2 /ASSEMBLY_ACC=CAM_ASM_000194 /LENGTH=224 /DNA_ID=CAMNT_0016341611 /DNA_START=37 /DNA_END=708 /DNA_ORIENTATION=+
MSDLNSLHAQARKLISNIRNGLERLELSEHQGNSSDLHGLSQDLQGQLKLLMKTSQEIDSVWRMLVIRESAGKRDIWKRKVEHVIDEVEFLRHALEKFTFREQKRLIERKHRDSLFERSDYGREGKPRLEESELRSVAMGSVQRSKQYLEEIFESGSQVLLNMTQNKERLKRTQRKALDMLHYVGLGDSILKLIDRKQRMDTVLTYGGMVVVTLIVLCVMYIYW